MTDLPRKLVVAALVFERGKLLLSRRRPDQPLPNLWELPGGKVELGEAPEAALRREVKEELGCGSVVEQIEDVLHHRYPEFEVVMLVYRCQLLSDPLPVEVAAVEWVPLDEIDRYDILPADRPLLARLRDRLTANRPSG